MYEYSIVTLFGIDLQSSNGPASANADATADGDELSIPVWNDDDNGDRDAVPRRRVDAILPGPKLGADPGSGVTIRGHGRERRNSSATGVKLIYEGPPVASEDGVCESSGSGIPNDPHACRHSEDDATD